VLALFSSMSLLKDSIIVLLFFFLIFAICGLNLFSGMLKNRCVNIDTGIMHPDDILCGIVECPDLNFCGKRNENPNFGATSFDTIFYSLLAIFQSVSLEGWSVIMQQVAMTYTPLSFIFFIPLVFIGAFFLLNLTLAVIKAKFSEAHDERAAAAERDKGKAEVKGTDVNIDDMNPEARKKYVTDQMMWREKINLRLRTIIFIKTHMRTYIKDFRQRKLEMQKQNQMDGSYPGGWGSVSPRKQRAKELVSQQLNSYNETKIMEKYKPTDGVIKDMDEAAHSS
jgi:hypothetical protein